jgi:peptidoglycan/LPS O-acetylase OafA/YrhL
LDRRFHSLDALRGAAALSVVLWHWQHFFWTPQGFDFDLSRMPLADAFRILYESGWLAVDLFFTLSGFVFYWLYANKIADRSITSARFAVLRASRLYPLHLVTLLLVAGMQIWALNTRGHTFVYEYNDLWHFALNLVLASAWGLQSGESFNGPAWSISIEVLLYGMFFVLCRWFPIRVTTVSIVALLGLTIIREHSYLIGRGVGSFFIGGGIYFTYHLVITSRYRPAVTRIVILTAITGWLVAFADVGADLGFLTETDQRRVSRALVVTVLFPSTVLALTLVEHAGFGSSKLLNWLGEASYSIYLLHFPLQLLVILVLAGSGVPPEVCYSPVFVAGFVVLLLLVSVASVRWFERPLQDRIRTSLLSE